MALVAGVGGTGVGLGDSKTASAVNCVEPLANGGGGGEGDGRVRGGWPAAGFRWRRLFAARAGVPAGRRRRIRCARGRALNAPLLFARLSAVVSGRRARRFVVCPTRPAGATFPCRRLASPLRRRCSPHSAGRSHACFDRSLRHPNSCSRIYVSKTFSSTRVSLTRSLHHCFILLSDSLAKIL